MSFTVGQRVKAKHRDGTWHFGVVRRIITDIVGDYGPLGVVVQPGAVTLEIEFPDKTRRLPSNYVEAA